MGALYGAVFGLAFFLGLIWWIGALAWSPWSRCCSPRRLSDGLRRPAGPGQIVVTGEVVGGGGRGMGVDGTGAGALSRGWALLGDARIPVGEYAATRGATQWIGTSGWSVVLIGVAAGVVVALEGRRFGPLAVSAATLIGLGIAGWLWPGVAEGEPLRVAIVQGNTPCPGTHCSNERYAPTCSIWR